MKGQNSIYTKNNTSGITLIALVITIIVLLILAGVSISAAIGENGILTRAEYATTEHRGGSVEELVGLWKLEKTTNTPTKDEDTLLKELLDNKQVYEEEIDRDAKTITIGSRVISYDVAEAPVLEDDDAKPSLKTMILKFEIDSGLTLEIPMSTDTEKYAYDFTVDWGDGTGITEINSSNYQTAYQHTYAETGEKTVKINGTFECLYEYRTGHESHILKEVVQWGDTGLKRVWLEDHTLSTNCLDKIAVPSSNSFKNLTYFYIFGGLIESLPVNLFAGAENLETLSLYSLESITEIPVGIFDNAKNLKGICIAYFDNLERIQSGLFKNNTELSYVEIRNNNITEIAGDLFKNNTELQEVDFSYNNIQQIPETLFQNNNKLSSVTFRENPFTGIPENLFQNCTNLTSVQEAFRDCTNLASIPEKLFENCNNIENFRRTFYGCTSLTGSSREFWTRGTNSADNEYKGNPDGEGCYKGCEGLEDYAQIPEYWKNYSESVGN